MSILIKDMEMPKMCSECPFYSRYETCCLIASYGCVDRFGFDFNKRQDWCPLEVTEQCKDAISRQAAIAVADFTDYTGLPVEDVKKVTDQVVKGLKQLPSAQPDNDMLHLQKEQAYLQGWEEGRKAQRWIPCSKTVDIPDHEIMACDRYGNLMFGFLAYDDDQWLCESDSEMMYDPIAWSEKPEPYREEGGE